MKLFKEISAKLASDGHLNRDKTLNLSATRTKTNIILSCLSSNNMLNIAERNFLNREENDIRDSSEKTRKRSLSEPLVKAEPIDGAMKGANVGANAPSSDESLLIQVPSNINIVTVKKGGRMWSFELK